MQALPASAAPSETVDDAMYKLVLSYCIDKAGQKIADYMGISHKEVKQRMARQVGRSA